MRNRATLWQILTRTLCVIALIAVGFAHRTPSITPSSLSPAELAALTLPDGTIPEFCLPGHEEDGQHKGHLATGDCQACLISASALMPTPADTAGARLPIIAETLLPPRLEAFHRHIFPPNAAPRAPPHPALV